eukprot:EG_transcript_19771
MAYPDEGVCVPINQPPAPSATVAFPQQPSSSAVNPRELLSIKREERRRQRAHTRQIFPEPEMSTPCFPTPAAASGGPPQNQPACAVFSCPPPRRRSVLAAGPRASSVARPSSRVSFHLPPLQVVSPSPRRSPRQAAASPMNNRLSQPTVAFSPGATAVPQPEMGTSPPAALGSSTPRQPPACLAEVKPAAPVRVSLPPLAPEDREDQEQSKRKSKKRKAEEADLPRESRWTRRMEREQMRKARQSEVETWVAEQKQRLVERSSHS